MALTNVRSGGGAPGSGRGYRPQTGSGSPIPALPPAGRRVESAPYGYNSGAAVGRQATSGNQSSRSSRQSAYNDWASNWQDQWAGGMARSLYAPDLALADLNDAITMNNIGRSNTLESLAGQETQSKIGDINSQLAFNRHGMNAANAKYSLDNRGQDIQDAYLARQHSYINDMLNLANQKFGIDTALQNVDAGEVERQFPLIAKAREDITGLHQILLQDISARDLSATRDERIKQLDMISQAAASGSAGAAMGVQRARETAAQLQDELANNQRRREEGNIKYQAALRDNEEQRLKAVDARERIRLEKERIEIEKQEEARRAAEQRKQVEDEQKRAALQRFYIALELQNAQAQWKRQQEAAMYAVQQANIARYVAAVQEAQNRDRFFSELARQQAERNQILFQQMVAANQARAAAPRAPARVRIPFLG